jgi:hypothetical protein
MKKAKYATFSERNETKGNIEIKENAYLQTISRKGQKARKNKTG